MGSTLVEQFKIAGEKGNSLQADTMELFAKSSCLLQYMPFENILGNFACFTTGETRVTEVLVVGGTDIDIDTDDIKKDKDCYDKFEQHIRRHVNGIERMMIKGNIETSPKGLDGLEVRCTNEQQLIDNGDGALSSYKIDELIDSVDEPTHLLMNEVMMKRITSVDISISYVIDAFNRKIPTYKDLPILTVDKDNDYEEILPFTEKDSSGTPQCTSIYCLSLAKNGLFGWQNGDMDVRGMGEIDTKRVGYTRVEWYIGLIVHRAKSIARLRYIKDGRMVN